MPINLLLVFTLCFSFSLLAESPPKQPIDVQSYSIKMDIDPAIDLKEFQSKVEVELKPLEDIQQVVLNAEKMEVTRVLLSRTGNQKLEFRQKEGKTLEIDLPKPAKKGKSLVVRIEYKGKIAEEHFGFFKVVDPDDAARGNLLFTMFEAEGARRFYPCHDVPYDKARTEIEVGTPAGNEVISNGKRISDKPFSKGKEKWHRVHWRQSKPHPTYLVSLAIAPFGKLSTAKKKPEIAVYVNKKKLNEAKYVFEALPKLVAIGESLTGVKYPWDKYAIVGVPTFLWGGMENTSSTHQNEGRTLLFDPRSALEQHKVIGLAAHELAHQWFGDLVTMQWWDDIWLNEAFATYTEGLMSGQFFKNEYSALNTVVSVWEDYFRQEDGPRSHPIVQKDKKYSDDVFDSISYQKGASVLRTLEVFMGTAAFRKGLTEYVKKFALLNASHEDFFTVMGKAASESLEDFRKSWILERGYPVVSYEGKWNAEKKNYQFQIRQRSNHTEDKTVFRFRLPVVFHRTTTPAYEKTHIIEMGVLGSLATTMDLILPDVPEWVTINPEALVLARLESHSDLDELEAQLTRDPDAVSRLWAARQIASPLVLGNKLSDAAESTLARWLDTEPSPYVRAEALELFQKMRGKWLPEKIAQRLLSLSDKVMSKTYEQSPLFLSDPGGWRIFQATVLGTLGKVNQKDLMGRLAAILGHPDLSLDNVANAAVAVAQLGEDHSGEVLKEASQLHAPRGYQYRLAIEGAFGAWENAKAAGEIRGMAKSCGHDLPSHWARLVKDNSTLRESPEWAASLKEILLTEERFGDELKSRLFSTVEELKTEGVFQMVSEVRSQSKSERLKEQAAKMIKKNFPNRLL